MQYIDTKAAWFRGRLSVFCEFYGVAVLSTKFNQIANKKSENRRAV